jgi:hypothetical protein
MSPLPACALLAVMTPQASLFAGDPKPNLLPTGSAETQICAIRSRLANNHDAARGRGDFNRLKAIMTNFVITQLEAEPRLDAELLRKQLTRILVVRSGDHSAAVFRKPLVPYTLPPGPAIWGVAYEVPLYDGWGGNRIIVDSFVVDQQRKARLTGRGGFEMSGFELGAFEVPNLSHDALSVMIYGMWPWSSGHSLPGKAILYSVNPGGVQALWQTPILPGLEAARVPLGPDSFMIQYHDESRHTLKLPDDRTIDTYRVTETGLKRVAHRHW